MILTMQRWSENGKVAVYCVTFVICMVGAAYASVPLYKLFCQVTGFASTTQIAENAPSHAVARTMEVHFNAFTDSRLNWAFTPMMRKADVKIGEVHTAVYRVTNRNPHTSKGISVFNVTPLEAGGYFNKLACFCFEEQTLQAGQSMEMVVQYFIDPALAEDRSFDRVRAMSLNYTFTLAQTQ